MQILMLSQFYPPIMGGIERHVHSLSLALTQRGHQVVVATLLHKGLLEFETVEGVKIYRISGSMQRLKFLFSVERQHHPPFSDPEITLALRKIIEKENPQVVHAHDWMVRSFLPLKAWSRAKLVRTLHDCELSCVQMRYIYKDGELCDGPAMRKCLACSSYHYGTLKGNITLFGNWFFNSLEKRGVDKYLPVSRAVSSANKLEDVSHKIEVVPNFILDDVADVLPIYDERLQNLPKEPFILQVGDLVKDKGIDVLLGAYKKLVNPPPLVLIGRRGAEFPVALPGNVTVFESLPHHLVLQAWKRCLFATVPSICLDASPTVTLEAMSFGKPVVGSRIGGIVDQVIDGMTGLLVPPNDEAALSVAMSRLIADSSLRKKMGEAAKIQVASFRESIVVNKIEALYKNL